jgi:hypothetical protein
VVKAVVEEKDKLIGLINLSTLVKQYVLRVLAL